MDVIKLKGKEEIEALIIKGVELDTQIKSLSAELNYIKEQLGSFNPGKFISTTGASVTISETPRYTDISPADAKQALRDKRLGQLFVKCIKVSVTELGKLLSDVELNALRERTGSTRRYSFKK